ncbi:MAG TPA: hypothetical protein DCM67_03580 [Propionibacteriaceae bacterium]|nr:hypothetical protein [Propionibacteriaceae bacterium]
MGIGIIGLGRLGGPLARGLAAAGIAEVYGFSRSRDKAEQIARQAAGLTLLDSAAEVLRRSDTVFVWMAPGQVNEVLTANADALSHRPILVNCSPGQDLGAFTDRWVDTYPNVNSATGQGSTLLSWGPGLADPDKQRVRSLLEAVGVVYEVEPTQLDAYCALTSNGPAFYAFILQAWADTVAERHGLDVDLARSMVRQTMVGTVALQEAEGIDAAAVIAQVAHPGGSTEPGLAVLAADFRPMAERMLQAMGRW